MAIYSVDPIVSRSNLIVFSHALVTKLKLSESKQVDAKGVHVRFPDGSEHIANVKSGRGEVILTAGTIRTPQILELSGIGDRKILTPLGIDVKINLPGVGENYEDQ